jgi:hypothetical protein
VERANAIQRLRGTTQGRDDARCQTARRAETGRHTEKAQQLSRRSLPSTLSPQAWRQATTIDRELGLQPVAKGPVVEASAICRPRRLRGRTQRTASTNPRMEITITSTRRSIAITPKPAADRASSHAQGVSARRSRLTFAVAEVRRRSDRVLHRRSVGGPVFIVGDARQVGEIAVVELVVPPDFG